MEVETPVSFMMNLTLSRSMSTGNLTRLLTTRRDSLPEVVRAAPLEEDRPLGPIRPISEGSTPENVSFSSLQECSSSENFESSESYESSENDAFSSSPKNSHLVQSSMVLRPLRSYSSSDLTETFSLVAENSTLDSAAKTIIDSLKTENNTLSQTSSTQTSSTTDNTIKEWLFDIANDPTMNDTVRLNEDSTTKKTRIVKNNVSKDLFEKVKPSLRNNHCPQNHLKQLRVGKERIVIQEKIARTPFANNEQVPRTPPGELLPRTPEVSQNQGSSNFFSTSNQPSTSNDEQQGGQKSTIVLVSEKNKRITSLVGPDDIVRLNRGEEGLNTINTVHANYKNKNKLTDHLKKEYGTEFQNKPNVQYDHSTPSNAHRNQNTSYDKGPVIASSIPSHKLKTQARLEQESYEFAVDASKSLITVSNGSTLMELSLKREMLDVQIIRTTPLEMLEPFGVGRDETLESTRQAHAMDRAAIRKSQKILGFRTSEEHYHHYLACNVADACNICNRELSELIVDKSPRDLINPEFIETVFNALTYNYEAKVLNESLSSKYPQTSNIGAALTRERHDVSFHLSHLIGLLENKGIDIAILHKYSPQLDNGNIVSFDRETLLGTHLNSMQLLQTDDEIDLMIRELRVGMVYAHVFRVLPATSVLDQQTTTVLTSSGTDETALPSTSSGTEETNLPLTSSGTEETNLFLASSASKKLINSSMLLLLLKMLHQVKI